MQSTALKKAKKRQFPSLRTWKPFVETTFCFDTDYDVLSLEYVKELNDKAWSVASQRPYIPLTRDCDDFARKMAVLVQELHADAGGKYPLAYAEDVGLRKDGMHAFNSAVTDSGIYIFDYGSLEPVENYKPLWVRF